MASYNEITMWLKKILIGLIILWLLLTTPLIVLAAEQTEVTLFATPIFTSGITNFIITYVSDTQLNFDWGYSGNVTKIMIRAKYGTYPDNIPNISTAPSDGYLIYYGDGIHASDTSVNFDESTGALYVRAWGQKANGDWKLSPSSGFKESAVLTLIGILVFCGIISFLAIRSNFFGLKLMGGMSWFAFFIYFKNNPPSIITEGDTAHTAILIVAIGFGLMIVLAGLGRGIQRSEKWNKEGDTQLSEGFNFKLPDWLNANNDSPEARRQKTEESLAEYRDKMQRALRTGRYRAGRR